MKKQQQQWSIPLNRHIFYSRAPAYLIMCVIHYSNTMLMCKIITIVAIHLGINIINSQAELGI